MPRLGIYGPIEVEFYQITPVGAQRITSGNLGNIDASLKEVLMDIYRRGGVAELDELKFSGVPHNPRTLRIALAKLVDLGYVMPVTAGPQGGAVPGAGAPPQAVPRTFGAAPLRA